MPEDGLKRERDFVFDEAHVLNGGRCHDAILGNLAGDDDTPDRGASGEVLFDPVHVSKNLADAPVVSAGHLGSNHHVGIVAAVRKNIDVALASVKLDTNEFAVLVFVEPQTRFQKSEVPDQIVLKVSLKCERPRSQIVVLGGLLADLVCRGDAVCNTWLNIGFVPGGRGVAGIPQADFARAQLEEQVQPAPGVMCGACRRRGGRTDIPSTRIPTVLLLIFGKCSANQRAASCRLNTWPGFNSWAANTCISSLTVFS